MVERAHANGGGAARRSSWLRGKQAIIALLLVVGALASVGIYVVASRADVRAREGELDRLANDRFGVILHTLDVQMGAVHSLRALFLAADEIDSHQFAVFAREVVALHPGVQALEWIPLVRAADRTGFERRQRQRQGRFSDYSIMERGTGEAMVPAGERSEYFPVLFIEPDAGNEKALGFDLASSAIRNDAIERARQSNEMAATAGITLVQDLEQEQGFLLLLPLTKNERFLGFLLGVFRVKVVIRTALEELEQRPIDVFITDQTDPSAPEVLAVLSSDGETQEPRPTRGGVGRERVVEVADRRWLVQCVPGRASELGRPSHGPLLMALLGLVLTVFLGWSIWVKERVAAGIEREQLQREFSRQIVDAQEEERQSLARELHDGVAQDLAAVSIHAHLQQSKYDGDVADGFERLAIDVRRTVADLRRLSYGLHPLALEERGLMGAVGELIERAKAASPSTTFHFEDGRDETPILGRDGCLGIYRTVQESLSNALRHAEAQNVWVDFLRTETALVVTVRDDGTGFDPEQHSAGLGLRSMHERAAFLNGSLTVCSGESGTAVTLVVARLDEPPAG